MKKILVKYIITKPGFIGPIQLDGSQVVTLREGENSLDAAERDLEIQRLRMCRNGVEASVMIKDIVEYN